MTGFGMWLLLLGGCCGESSRCVLKVTLLGTLVMASRTVGGKTGVSLGTLNLQCLILWMQGKIGEYQGGNISKDEKI